MRARSPVVAIITMLAMARLAPAQAPERVHSPQVVGDLRLETLSSTVFGNTRKLRILLPDGYDAPENRGRRYPVLYMADGQNLYDPAMSVFGPSEWRMDETVHTLVAEKRIQPMIVVGVDDAGRIARAHEYLPWPDTANAKFEGYDPKPEGARYPDFLINEVMPFVDARYRTRSGPANTGIGGSSYGALISMYVVSKRPGVFGRALIESPTALVYGFQLVRDVEAAASLPERVFVAVGGNEDQKPGCVATEPVNQRDPMVFGTQQLTDALQRKGLDAARLKVIVEPCATHTHAAWARRLPEAMVFLFGER